MQSHYLLANIVPFFRATIWGLCQRFFSSVQYASKLRCVEIKVFWKRKKKSTKEMIEMISGYIERINQKAVVVYYENFTKINPSSWAYNEVWKGWLSK